MRARARSDASPERASAITIANARTYVLEKKGARRSDSESRDRARARASLAKRAKREEEGEGDNTSTVRMTKMERRTHDRADITDGHAR